MHDRRLDGQTHVFGNAGGLFMRAMTWWDHETQSIWSQPWGRAISGELDGAELTLLPSQVTSWENWVDAHPDTLVMTNDTGQFRLSRQGFDPDFVIGLLLAGQARAYPYQAVAEATLVNDFLGEVPVVIWATQGDFRAYVREVGRRELTFTASRGEVVDQETGTLWDMARGLAVAGALQGEALQSVPSLTAYDWAWFDFYPESTSYQPQEMRR